MTAKQQAASKCTVLWLDDSFLLFSCVHELFTFDPKEADNFLFFLNKDKLIVIDLSGHRRVFFVFKSKPTGSDPDSCLEFLDVVLERGFKTTSSIA